MEQSGEGAGVGEADPETDTKPSNLITSQSTRGRRSGGLIKHRMKGEGSSSNRVANRLQSKSRELNHRITRFTPAASHMVTCSTPRRHVTSVKRSLEPLLSRSLFDVLPHQHCCYRPRIPHCVVVTSFSHQSTAKQPLCLGTCGALETFSIELL